jgi:hypothetical protein
MSSIGQRDAMVSSPSISRERGGARLPGNPLTLGTTVAAFPDIGNSR